MCDTDRTPTRPPMDIRHGRVSETQPGHPDLARQRDDMACASFSRKLMDGMRPHITELVSEIVKENLGRGPIDFLNLVAAQLPARIVAEILAVPREHAPRKDFLSELIAEVGTGGLSEGELRMQMSALILAGSDTTRDALCMTLSTLLQHPEHWLAFCANPDGLKKAVVQEGLDFALAVESVARVAVEDIEVFGAGAYRCVGEALTRAVLEEAMAAIAKLAPNTTLSGNPPKLSHLGLRQVDRMLVAFAAGQAASAKI